MADRDKVYKDLHKVWQTLDEYSVNGTPFDMQIVLDRIFDALELLKEQEVIRCKDCKFSSPDMMCNHPIEWDNGESRNHCDPEWFCADGKRK